MSAGPRGRNGIPERPSCKYPASTTSPELVSRQRTTSVTWTDLLMVQCWFPGLAIPNARTYKRQKNRFIWKYPFLYYLVILSCLDLMAWLVSKSWPGRLESIPQTNFIEKTGRVEITVGGSTPNPPTTKLLVTSKLQEESTLDWTAERHAQVADTCNKFCGPL